MRFYHVGLLTVGMLLWTAALPAAEQPSVGELTRELTGEKPAAERTPEQLEAVYALVIESLMPDMAAEDAGKRGGPQGTLERIAFRAVRPGAEAERVACSKAIAAKLGPEVGPLGRAWLIRQLERIGRAEAVPSLAKLLADKDPLVRESARRALRKNTAKEANAALQAAVGSADSPAWRAAIVNALAERCDPANLDLLMREAASADDDVRTAAVVGLAKLGDRSALVPIAGAVERGSPATRAIATDCFVRLAGALVAKGDKATALNMYKRLLVSKMAARAHLKCAALIGIGRAGSAADLPVLLDALADQDVKVRGACVEALGLLESKDVTAAIADRIKTSKPETKPALLQALARRGDDLHIDTFLDAAKDPDEAVQMAAIAGLGVLKENSVPAVEPLLEAAARGGKLQEVARQSLQSVRGTCVNDFLGETVNHKDPKIRVEVIRALAARHVVAATPALLKAADDADAGVRTESLKTLAAVAPSEALPAVAALLVKTDDDGTRNEAAAALVTIANRDRDVEKRSESVLRALGASNGPARLAILSVLGRIGGQKSLEAVRAAVGSGDEKIKDAAIRAMAEWPDAVAATDLLAVARGAASETHQVLAIRGYIRVCRIRTSRPESETAKMLAAGLQSAKRADEKRQALGGLAEVRDILALDAVVPCMGDEALREEAASAAVRIGREICDRHPEAVKTAMEKAIAVSKNDNLKREAKEALDRAEQRLREAKAKK